MIDRGDVLKDIQAAMGHLCVPFSTEQECDEGADLVILILFMAFKSLRDEHKLKYKPSDIVQQLWLGLESTNSFSLISKRLLDTLTIMDSYASSVGDERVKLKAGLKSRGLL
jgi:hypothetical protein